MARSNQSNRGRGSGARSTHHSTTRRSNASRAPQPAPQRPNVWRWYGSGLLSGVVLCLGIYLVTLPPEPLAPEAETVQKVAAVEEEKPKANTPPKPRFDFYTMLPEQTIDVDVEPADVARPSHTSSANEFYLLQAGSFRQREDADRRRAELILLGLEPRIEESHSDTGRWFRVFLGPFQTHSTMARARSLTAGQDIDTLLLKRQG